MSKITRLPVTERLTPDAIRASIIPNRIKQAYDHAEILRLAMVGAASENGLDFEKDALLEAAYDLAIEIGRLARDVAEAEAA